MPSKSMATDDPGMARARVGDWLEARSIHGGVARRGEVVEILGGAGHEHYRVLWEEAHESIVFPADGLIVIPRGQAGLAGSGQ
jgi:Domain of unknown function (DUF1918)